MVGLHVDFKAIWSLTATNCTRAATHQPKSTFCLRSRRCSTAVQECLLPAMLLKHPSRLHPVKDPAHCCTTVDWPPQMVGKGWFKVEVVTSCVALLPNPDTLAAMLAADLTSHVEHASIVDQHM